MGRVKVRHYCLRRGGTLAYWVPTPTMKAHGFQLVPLGRPGPDAIRLAEEWNEKWDRVRTGREPPPKHVYPIGSVGEGFNRFRLSETWQDKAPRTREDWERGWKFIEPVFGDVAPMAVTFELLDSWYYKIKRDKSVSEAHRAMKIWRALWRVLASYNYCQKDTDPSLGIRRETPKGRSATWSEVEVIRIVKQAWRLGYHGLACIVAVAYDAALAPVDARSLTFAASRQIGGDIWFEIDRTKTGRPTRATLSRRTQALVWAYIATLDPDYIPSAPIFLNRSGRMYSKDTLGDDFRAIRSILFIDDKRQLQDVRRTGAVEALTGGADAGALSAKLANTIGESKVLQQVYLPSQPANVAAADAARKVGRKRLAENKTKPKVETLIPGQLKPVRGK